MSSFLSPQFAERLRGGKYTYWVTRVPFSEQHLECLLWTIGEFAAGGSRILRLLDDAGESGGRDYLALEALWWMVSGERFGRDQWSRRITGGGSPLQVRHLPEAAHPAVHALSATWDFVLAIGPDFELIRKDAQGRRSYAYVSGAGAVTYSGPERQKGQLKGASLIPAAMDERLARGRCTKWAAARGFPEEELRCLLWLVDEFACRSFSMFKLLEREKDQLSEHRRAVLALQAMRRIVDGERFDTAELLRRMERGRAHLEQGDLPGALRASLERAAPGFAWNPPRMHPDCFVTFGTAPDKSEAEARLYHDGRLVFRKIHMEARSFPPPVLAAVESRLPGYQVLLAYSVGPSLDAVDHYELLLQEPAHKLNESFVMSADGSVIERRDWRN